MSKDLCERSNLFVAVGFLFVSIVLLVWCLGTVHPSGVQNKVFKVWWYFLFLGSSFDGTGE